MARLYNDPGDRLDRLSSGARNQLRWVRLGQDGQDDP
jgi:hypothetical protein